MFNQGEGGDIRNKRRRPQRLRDTHGRERENNQTVKRSGGRQEEDSETEASRDEEKAGALSTMVTRGDASLKQTHEFNLKGESTARSGRPPPPPPPLHSPVLL